MVDTYEVELKKHELVRQHLVAKIGHEFKAHERLPAERELADALNVNRMTVRRALSELERDGLIYRVQGSGTFVSASHIDKSLEFTSFSEDMRARNMAPGSLLVESGVRAAGLTVGYALGLSPMSPVVHLRRIRTADAIPMCLENAYLPAHLVPGLENGIEGDSLYDDLERRFDISARRADQRIHVTVLDESDAQQLLVPPFSPAFLVRRTAFDVRGQAVEYAESLYRGDRYSYSVAISRPVGHRSE